VTSEISPRSDPRHIERLLLWLLSSQPGEPLPGLDELSDADWASLVGLAIRQGVPGLLYHRLSTSLSLLAPDDVLAELRSWHLQTALDNMALYRELHRVLSALREAGIQVLVLKGAHLAQAVYRDLALRSMKDADILVRLADLERAEACLAGLGYQLFTESADRTWYARNHFHFHYLLPDSGVRVELHWGLVPPGSTIQLDLTGLWERSEQAIIAGIQVRVLSPEDHLLYLCLHLTRQFTFNYFGVRSLHDLVLLTRYFGAQLDWAGLGTRARAWGSANATYLALLLAKELLGAALPPDLEDHLSPDRFDSGYLALAEERVFYHRNRIEDPALGVPMSDRFGRLWRPGRLSEKLSLSLQTFFPSPEALAVRYDLASSSRHVYLYYPRRWAELVAEHSRRSWRLLQRDPQALIWAERERRRITLASWLDAA
jgi:hypothetical protein